jgi:hypothetical protein
MPSLIEDLELPKVDLKSFSDMTKRVIVYLSAVASNKKIVRGFAIISSDIAGTKKYTRPINIDLFIDNSKDFDKLYNSFINLLKVAKASKNKHSYTSEDHKIINRVLYTIQQSVGLGLDLLSEPNSARKHVGNRFEELIKLVINEIGVANKKITFKIPYSTDKKEKPYRCETDIIISPYSEVKSKQSKVNEKELVVSLKTSSKDRMGKIFLDKMLMRKFANKDIKVIGIFLNDVQRKEADNISFTFVAHLFMVYTKFLVELEGVYYLDPPPRTLELPYNEHIFKFSKFIFEDIWTILTP